MHLTCYYDEAVQLYFPHKYVLKSNTRFNFIGRYNFKADSEFWATCNAESSINSSSMSDKNSGFSHQTGTLRNVCFNIHDVSKHPPSRKKPPFWTFKFSSEDDGNNLGVIMFLPKKLNRKKILTTEI